MIERLELNLNFQKKIRWLQQKPQIKYWIESNPEENMVKYDKEREKDDETSVEKSQSRKVSIFISTDHTLLKFSLIGSTWALNIKI